MIIQGIADINFSFGHYTYDLHSCSFVIKALTKLEPIFITMFSHITFQKFVTNYMQVLF